jgi:transcriptional regulator with XRE-family HTH domain
VYADTEIADRARQLGLADVVHNRRLAAKLTLARLAQLTALSPSFLSQFENGHTNTSLRSLQRIADALGTTTTQLLAEADPRPSEAVVRAGAQAVLPHTDSDETDPEADGSVRSLVHGRRELRALEYTGGTDRSDREFAHDNDELIYVACGSITIVAESEEIELAGGDAYYCAAGVKHRWWAHTGDTRTITLAVADGLVVRHPPHRPR